MHTEHQKHCRVWQQQTQTCTGAAVSEVSCQPLGERTHSPAYVYRRTVNHCSTVVNIVVGPRHPTIHLQHPTMISTCYKK